MRFVVTTIAFALAAFAASPVTPINKNSDGVALHGYDAAAYFTEGKPVKGSKEFESEWMGAKWRFSSAANRDTFKSDPAKYAPQYGGYCAYAVSKGRTADISPNAWKVVDGKLYVNHPLAKSRWEKDIPGAIARAGQNWPNIPRK
jgi:YHS domain-containing protein